MKGKLEEKKANVGFASLIGTLEGNMLLLFFYFLFLLETHSNRQNANNTIKKVGWDGSFIEDASGQSGGIWCI